MYAFDLHQWLTAPDFDQEGEVKRAEAALSQPVAWISPLLTAALTAHAWLERDGARAPLRAALIRHWTRHKLLRAPVPLTGPKAFRPDR